MNNTAGHSTAVGGIITLLAAPGIRRGSLAVLLASVELKTSSAPGKNPSIPSPVRTKTGGCSSISWFVSASCARCATVPWAVEGTPLETLGFCGTHIFLKVRQQRLPSLPCSALLWT